MSWYSTGFEGMDKEQERQDTMYGPSRMRVPVGKSQDIVFVDDEPFAIYEHSPKIAGEWSGNEITCVQGVHDDVVCCQILGPSSRYYAGYCTVVDCSEWTDKRGVKHQYELKLVQAKMRTLKKFRRKKDDRGKLTGSLYTASRDDEKSPKCGDEFEFKRDVDMAKLFDFATYKGKKLSDMWDEAEKDEKAMTRVTRLFQIKPDSEGRLPRRIAPFNYFEILKPKSAKELRIFLGAVDKDQGNDRGGRSGSGSSGGGGGGASGGGGGGEENVPF